MLYCSGTHRFYKQQPDRHKITSERSLHNRTSSAERRAKWADWIWRVWDFRGLNDSRKRILSCGKDIWVSVDATWQQIRLSNTRTILLYGRIEWLYSSNWPSWLRTSQSPQAKHFHWSLWDRVRFEHLFTVPRWVDNIYSLQAQESLGKYWSSKQQDKSVQHCVRSLQTR